MNEAHRYDKGLGGGEIYLRIVYNGGYWNFATSGASLVETEQCRVFMGEIADSSPDQSWYVGSFTPPPIGPWPVEIVRLSTGEVIGATVAWGDPNPAPGHVPIAGMPVSRIILDSLPRVATMKVITGTTFIEAINYITSMISKRVMNRRSDLLGTEEVTWNVAPGTTYYPLPEGFISPVDQPRFVVTGERRATDVRPLSRERSWWWGQTSNIHKEFELLGQQIAFYPEVDAGAPAATVTLRYRSLLQQVSGPADVIPFGGLFDQVYFQGVPRVVVKGLSIAQADADFELFLRNEVDTVLNARTMPVSSRSRTSRRNFL